MRSRGVALERLLFAVLLTVHLLPLCLFPRFPSQDGPSHQGVTAVLRQLDGEERAAAVPRLTEVFARNRGVLPNTFIFWLLEKDFGFTNVAAAEKILLAGYVVLFLLGLRFAVVSVDRRAAFLSWLGFPFVYNDLVHMGFYNFCYSLGAFLFTVGAYWRWRERMTPARLLGLALLVTWVYLCHPVTLVVTVTALGTIALWDLVLELHPAAERTRDPFRTALARLGPPLLAALPALGLTVHFIQSRLSTLIAGPSFAVRAKLLAGLYSLASLDRLTAFLAAGVALLLFTLTALMLAERRRSGEPGSAAGSERAGTSMRLVPEDGFFAVIAVLLAAYFLTPNQMVGGGFLIQRLNLFPFLVLILALATRKPRRFWRPAVPALATVLALAFLALFARSYARLDSGLAEIAAVGSAVQPGRTFLYLSYAHEGANGEGMPPAFRVQPFVHAGSAVAAERRAVDLSLYEANEDYFPVIYRPRTNPYTHLATMALGIEGDPPQVDLEAYLRTTGVPVDYVLLWGWKDERRGEPGVDRIVRQLAAGYDEVRRSRSGRARLYRSRAWRPRPDRLAAMR